MLKTALENKWLAINSIAIVVLAMSIRFGNSDISTYVVPSALYDNINTEHDIRKTKFVGYEAFLEISDDPSVLNDKTNDELISTIHLLVADLNIYNELVSVGGTISHTGMQNNSDGFVSSEYRIVGTPFSILRRR